MRAGLTASTLAHGAVLVLALVSFNAPSALQPPPESLPVEVVSSSELSQMTKGAKTSPKADKPKQVAEKVDVPKPAENPDVKVTNKEEVNPTAPPPPPPAPQPPQPKAEDKTPTPPKAPEAPKVEQKADESLKPEPKKEEPKQEAHAAPTPPAPLPPKKPAPPPPKPVQTQPQERSFNTDQIQALLDKRAPQRQAAASSELSSSSALGTARGSAQSLSQSEIDAFRARMRQCWNPIGVPSDQGLFVLLGVSFRPDGTLAGDPVVIEGKASPYGGALMESAIRALKSCQPYTMLSREKYDLWRNMELKFTPQMFDG